MEYPNSPARNLPLDPILQIPIYPSNSKNRFRTTQNLLPTQHILLDNLWTSKNNTSYFLHILRTLAIYFDNLNMESIASPSTMLSTTNIPLKPQSLDFFASQERKIQILEEEIQWRKKEDLSQKKRIIDLENQLQELSTFIKTEQKEREDRLEHFPEKIAEVKRLILQKVLRTDYEDFIAAQDTLKKIALGNDPYPAGFAIAGFTFGGEETHKRQMCYCDHKITIFKATFDLSMWHNQYVYGYFITVDKLLQYGMITRIIITKDHQLKHLTYNWRFNVLMHKLMKGANRGSFFNLNIESIPPGYETGYPDDARHRINVEVIQESYPFQIVKEPEFYEQQLGSGTTMEQTTLWRALALSRKQPNLGLLRPLIFEDRQMKVFLSKEYLPICMPFGNTVSHMPEATAHFKTVKACFRIIELGDYMNSYLLDNFNPIDGEEIDEFDALAEHNLANMLEA